VFRLSNPWRPVAQPVAFLVSCAFGLDPVVRQERPGFNSLELPHPQADHDQGRR
jgi:hypothetical protein